MARSDTGEDRKLNRLGGFMDAVFAIAITLPIVQLTSPAVRPGFTLAMAYRQLTSEFLAYVLGFVVIGLFWNYSHFGSKLLRRSDHGFNLLTLLFLACVSLTPFPAKPYVEHLQDASNVDVASLVYGCGLAAPVVVWFLRWCWGISRGLYHPDLKPGYVRSMTLRYALATLLAIGGVSLLLLHRSRTGLAAVGIATLSFLLPPSDPFREQETSGIEA